MFRTAFLIFCTLFFCCREGSIRANISLLFDPNATVSTAELANAINNVSTFGSFAVDPSTAKVTGMC